MFWRFIYFCAAKRYDWKFSSNFCIKGCRYEKVEGQILCIYRRRFYITISSGIEKVVSFSLVFNLYHWNFTPASQLRPFTCVLPCFIHALPPCTRRRCGLRDSLSFNVASKIRLARGCDLKWGIRISSFTEYVRHRGGRPQDMWIRISLENCSTLVC